MNTLRLAARVSAGLILLILAIAIVAWIPDVRLDFGLAGVLMHLTITAALLVGVWECWRHD